MERWSPSASSGTARAEAVLWLGPSPLPFLQPAPHPGARCLCCRLLPIAVVPGQLPRDHQTFSSPLPFRGKKSSSLREGAGAAVYFYDFLLLLWLDGLDRPLLTGAPQENKLTPELPLHIVFFPDPVARHEGDTPGPQTLVGHWERPAWEPGWGQLLPMVQKTLLPTVPSLTVRQGGLLVAMGLVITKPSSHPTHGDAETQGAGCPEEPRMSPGAVRNIS